MDTMNCVPSPLKAKIPAKVFSMLKEVVVDVIAKQIEKRQTKSKIGKQKHEDAQLSALQFERELRNRIDSLEMHIENTEGLIRQGLRLYESAINQIACLSSHPQIIIHGDVTMNIAMNYIEKGNQFIGQTSTLTTENLSQLVGNEANKMFDIVDSSDLNINQQNVSTQPVSKREQLQEKFNRKVKEMRK